MNKCAYFLKRSGKRGLLPAPTPLSSFFSFFCFLNNKPHLFRRKPESGKRRGNLKGCPLSYGRMINVLNQLVELKHLINRHLSTYHPCAYHPCVQATHMPFFTHMPFSAVHRLTGASAQGLSVVSVATGSAAIINGKLDCLPGSGIHILDIGNFD